MFNPFWNQNKYGWRLNAKRLVFCRFTIWYLAWHRFILQYLIMYQRRLVNVWLLTIFKVTKWLVILHIFLERMLWLAVIRKQFYDPLMQGMDAKISLLSPNIFIFWGNLGFWMTIVKNCLHQNSVGTNIFWMKLCKTFPLNLPQRAILGSMVSINNNYHCSIVLNWAITIFIQRFSCL